MSDFVIELQGTQVSKPPMEPERVVVAAGLPAPEPAFCEIYSSHLKEVFSDISGPLC